SVLLPPPRRGREKQGRDLGGPVRVPSLVLLFLARIATIRGPSAGRDHGRFRPTGWEGESKRAWLATCAGPSLVPSSSWPSSSRSSTPAPPTPPPSACAWGRRAVSTAAGR